MATIKVSENYAKAKSGKPPVGNFKPRQEMSRNPTVKRNFPASTSPPAGKAPVKHHVASKAVKTGLKATPQGRAASTALRAKPKKAFKGSAFTGKLPKSDKRTTSFIGKATNHSPILVAEFVGGLAIIAIAMFTRTASEKYQDVMSSILARYTAFTAIFFILFLMGTGSKRSSQAAAWFGLIIDLGLLFDATNHNVFEDLSAFINGTGLPAKTVTVSATKPEEFFATADIKDTTQQGGVAQSAVQQPNAANAPASGSSAKPGSASPPASKAIGNRGSAGGGTTQILDTPTGSLGT